MTRTRLPRPASKVIFALLWSHADTFIRRRLALALLLGLASSAIAGAAPLLLKLVVDALVAPDADALYLPATAFAIAYAGSQWIVRSLQEARMLAYGRADQRLQRRVSLRLFAHVMKLPLHFHLDRKTGALGQTLNNGLLGCRLIIQQTVLSVIPVVIEVLVMSYVLIFLGQPVFLAVIGASLILYTFVFTTGAARIAKSARAASAANIGANALMTDGILNYETVKCFNAQAAVQERFDAALLVTERHWKRFYTRKLENGFLVAAIFALSLGTSMVVASGAVSRGSLSIGEFILIHTYLLRLVGPVETLGFALRDMAQGIAFIEKLAGILDRQPEEAKKNTKRIVTAGCGVVFDHVSFAYHPGRPVLEDVSFAIPEGKTVVVVGVSGSGKSSLVRLLLRFCEPDTGRILLGGTSISGLSVCSLREMIAVVPQDAVLFNDTISYNIGIARPRSSAKDIERAARVAQLGDFIAAQPDRYETQVGEYGVRLSGGERQRVAIARAVLKTPRIFVFDEATSSLDYRTERAILQNIREIASGATTLIIAHRLSAITDADQIVVLDKGQVLECGTHEVLRRKDGVYASLWNAQQRELETEANAAGLAQASSA